jgi:hypothetical protein
VMNVEGWNTQTLRDPGASATTAPRLKCGLIVEVHLSGLNSGSPRFICGRSRTKHQKMLKILSNYLGKLGYLR